MDELENTKQAAEELARALEQLNRGVPLTAEQMERVRKAEALLQDQTYSLKDAFKAAGKIAIDLGDGFLETASAARDARDKFQSLDGIINAVGKSVPLVGEGLAAAGTYMTKSIDQVVDSFERAGGAGAIGAGGMTAFNQSVTTSKLGLDGFSRAVSQNSSDLAFALGNTRIGASQLADVVGDDNLFRQIKSLGFGLEDTADFTAAALAEQRRLGRSERLSTNQIIALTGQYAERVASLSSLTGQQADQIQESLRATQRDARVRAAMAAATAEFGPKIGQSIEDTIVQIQSTAGGSAIAEGFGDLLFNAGTEAGANLQKITGGTAQDIADRLKRDEITQGQAVEQLRTAIANFADGIGGPVALGQLAKQGTFLDAFGVEIFEFTQRVGTTAKNVDDINKGTKAAAEATDPLTNEIVRASANLRNFAAEVDKFVLDTMLPLSSKMTEVMTDGLDKVMSLINDIFGNGDPIQTSTAYVDADGNVVINGEVQDPNSAAALQHQRIIAEAEGMGGAATGGPIPSGKLTMVGELGPEIIRPQTASHVTTAEDVEALVTTAKSSLAGIPDMVQGLSQVTTAEDVQALVDTAKSSLAGIPSLVEGLHQVFMPGIGTATSYGGGGMEKLIIEGLDGIKTELSSFVIPGQGSNTMVKQGDKTFTKSSLEGGYTYAPVAPGESWDAMPGMKTIGGYDINTSLRQTGGPRSMYDTMMDQFRQDSATIRTFTQRGGTPDQIATPNINDPEVKELLSSIANSMRQVEAGVGKQVRTSENILRATTN